MTTPTDPPAFPSHARCLNPDGTLSHSYELHAEGLSLRDYFAAHALPALIALTPVINARTDTLPAEICAAAYGFADSMIAQRSAPATKPDAVDPAVRESTS